MAAEMAQQRLFSAAPTPRPGPVVPALRDADAGDRGPFARDTWQHVGLWLAGKTDVPPDFGWRRWAAPCGCLGRTRRASDGGPLGHHSRWCEAHVRGPAFDWSTAVLEAE